LFLLKRVFLIVLDSVGVGALPDAEKYGDVGANTMAHILKEARPSLPNMAALGLGKIPLVDYPVPPSAAGAYGRAMEVSPGKDTTTGHWEMMGLTLQKPFPTYPDGFPPQIIQAFEQAIGRKSLGNYAASGTEILDQLGEEHLKTGYPIVYTSADSVFQIACHEDIVPIRTLYDWCEIARDILQGEHAVGRVIARPFTGPGKGAFSRTPRRRDFSLPPTGETLLDAMKAQGLMTIGIGKIEDIFCMRGLVESNHAAGNPACMEAMMDTVDRDFKGLVFVNLVDFDSVYGHRRDADGYARALEAFDVVLGKLTARMGGEDLVLITADHGCDPTFTGTDHTREHTPLLAWHPGMKGLTDLGTRGSFADIAATIAELFGLPQRFGAQSFAAAIE